MIAASWTYSIRRSLGPQNESSRPVPMRIHRAQARTVWPYARSSLRTSPANELSPRSGCFFVGVPDGGFSDAGGALGTAFHSWVTPSQYHLPSGETRSL